METLTETGRFLLVAIQAVIALGERFSRRQSERQARLRVGEACYQDAPDDCLLARQIAALDQRISELQTEKKSPRQLEADRQRLLMQLADESVPVRNDEKSGLWHAARQAVVESDQRVQSLFGQLKPRNGHHLFRLAAGFAAIVLIGSLLWGGGRKPADQTRQFVQTGPQSGPSRRPTRQRSEQDTVPRQKPSNPLPKVHRPEERVAFGASPVPRPEERNEVPPPRRPEADNRKEFGIQPAVPAARPQGIARPVTEFQPPAIQPPGTTLPPAAPSKDKQPEPPARVSIPDAAYQVQSLSYIEFLQDKLVEAHRSAQAAAKNKKDLASMIASARAEYWSRYPDGEGVDEARGRFARLLWQKDFFYWTTYIVEGREGVAARTIDTLTGGALDGGIEPFARDEFFAWVDGCRATMGARSDKDLVLVTPDGLVKALSENKSRYEDYCAERDRSEFFKGPRSPLLRTDPRDYLVAAFMRDRWGSSMEVAAGDYEALVNFWGKDRTLEIARLVQSQPKQADRFTFANPQALDWPYEPPKSQPDAIDYVDILLLKEAMTTNDPRKFVLAFDSWRGATLQGAQKELERLEKKYGPDKVLQHCRDALAARDPEDYYGKHNLALRKLAQSLELGAVDQRTLSILSSKLGDAEGRRRLASLEAEYGREVVRNAEARFSQEAELARANKTQLPDSDRFIQLVRARIGFQLIHDNETSGFSFGSSRLHHLGVTADGKLWGSGGNLFGMNADGRQPRQLLALQNESPSPRYVFTSESGGDRRLVVERSEDKSIVIVRTEENLELKSNIVSLAELEGRVRSAQCVDQDGVLYGTFMQDFRDRKSPPPPRLRLFRHARGSDKLELVGNDLPHLFHGYSFVHVGDGWLYGIRMGHDARAQRKGRDDVALFKLRRDGSGYEELLALKRFFSFRDGEPGVGGNHLNNGLVASGGAIFALLSSDDLGVRESELEGRAEAELIRYDTVKNEYAVLHRFGRYMYATTLIEGPHRMLYGVMTSGRPGMSSALFRISREGANYEVLDVDAAESIISLTADDSALYGTIDGRIRKTRVNGVFRFGLIPPVD